ncbi:hypothetical protein LTR08_006004 [Meristemomyces frigidus]|nr:hypothetical protein LTR08_006004 [Meristemomyces frigidus]
MSALQDKDSNAESTTNPENTMVMGTENRPGETGQHRQVLDQKLGKQSGAYVSPSDAILSPASEKLMGFKQRQINRQQSSKSSTSRTLFARTPSDSTSGFDDVVNAGEEKKA